MVKALVVAGRLPVRVAPVEGEAIDSWIAATAQAMEVSIGSVTRSFGLPVVSRPLWVTWLAADQIDQIAAAASIPGTVVESMTLSVYDGIALKLNPTTHRLDEDFPFSAVGFSRFCPECLSESGGRWQLQWRLGWTFACLRHTALLLDECPQCAKHQRQHQNFGDPSPASCKCGFDLQTVLVDTFPASHPIIRAQQRVHDVFDHGNTSFGVFEASATSALEVLTAIRSLANRVLNFASVEGLDAVAVAELPLRVARRERMSRPLRARSAINNRVPWRAVDTAVGVTAALSILDASTIHEAGHRVRPYVEGQNATTGAAELRSCARDGVIPAAVMIKASTPWMGPELELRYRAVTAVPHAPNRGADRARRIAAALPTLMWPTWSDLLLSGLRRRTVVARETLSWATLLAGSTIDTVAAANLLNRPQLYNTLNQRLWVFRHSASWEPICAGLITLGDYLDRHGALIDYDRRRRLDYSTLLSEQVWEQMCSEVDGPIPQTSAASGRAYMVEVLTGCPTSRERQQRLWSGKKAAFRDPPKHMLSVLDEHAREFLKRQGVNEPLSWYPPLDLLDERCRRQP